MKEYIVSEECIIQSWGENPSCLIIMLHGFGSSAADLESLGENFSHSRSSIRVIYINAPFRPISVFDNQMVRAWFDLNVLDWKASIADASGLYSSCNLVSRFVEDGVNKGFAPERIFLGGFSQGGFVALFSSMISELKIGGVFSLSAFMRKHDLPEGVSRMDIPMFVAEGKYDVTVPEKIRGETRAVLQGICPDHLTHKIYNSGHQIIKEEIDDLKQWMYELLDSEKHSL